MSGTWIKRVEGTVETTSRLKAWWMHRFLGYEILERKLRPQKGAFGRVSLARVWTLKVADTKAESI